MTGRESHLGRLQELLVAISVAALVLLTAAARLPAPVAALDVAVEDVRTAIGLARLEALRGGRPALVELDVDGDSLIVRRRGVAAILHRLHLSPAIRASQTLPGTTGEGWRLEFDPRGRPIGPRLGLALSVDGQRSQVDVDALGHVRILTQAWNG